VGEGGVGEKKRRIILNGKPMMDVCRDISIGRPAKCDRCGGGPVCASGLARRVIDPSRAPGATTNP